MGNIKQILMRMNKVLLILQLVMVLKHSSKMLRRISIMKSPKRTTIIIVILAPVQATEVQHYKCHSPKNNNLATSPHSARTKHS